MLIHLCYYLWLLSCCNSGVKWLLQGPYDPQNLKYLLFDPLQKKLANSCSKCLQAPVKRWSPEGTAKVVVSEINWWSDSMFRANPVSEEAESGKWTKQRAENIPEESLEGYDFASYEGVLASAFMRLEPAWQQERAFLFPPANGFSLPIFKPFPRLVSW